MAEKTTKQPAPKKAQAETSDHNVLSKEEGDRVSAELLANC